MANFPTDPKKLRTRIRSYERKLQREKDEFGGCGDGAGKRYSLAPMYLLMGDLDGALESFRWYEKQFRDDCGEPGHYLCWTLALFRSGDRDAATRKLRQTMLANLYLIPHLLGTKVEPLDIWHGSNWAWASYVREIPREYLDLWAVAEKEWGAAQFYGAAFDALRKRYIDIHRTLKGLAPGSERTRLCKEAAALGQGALPLHSPVA